MAARQITAGSFGALLRSYRVAACLTQEGLAERARLSVDAIAALERGRRTAPRAPTVALLAEALALNPDDRAALDWSHELLAEAERTLFARLGIFVGGATLEAIEAICAADSTLQSLEGIEALLEQSLIIRTEDEEGGGAPRFGMLETIREYAVEQLEERGEREVLSRRHANWYMALAEQAEQELRGTAQQDWLERLEREHGNLRVALSWARERDEAEIGLRTAGALSQFWQVRGYLREGRDWLLGLLALPGAEVEAIASVRAKALLAASVLASWLDDYPQAAALAEESLALCRGIGDTRGIALALSSLGGLASFQGDAARAAVLDGEAVSLYREPGDTRGIAIALGNLGTAKRALGEDAQAAALFEESLSLFRQLGDPIAIATRLYSVATVAQKQGDYVRAATLYKASLDLRRQLNDRQRIADSLQGLADVALAQGDFGRARVLYAESQGEAEHLGYKLVFVGNLEGLAAVACAEGQPERAARLFGAAEALRAAIGSPSYVPAGRAMYERTLAQVHSALSEAQLNAAWTAGATLPLHEVIDDALAPDRPYDP